MASQGIVPAESLGGYFGSVYPGNMRTGNGYVIY